MSHLLALPPPVEQQFWSRPTTKVIIVRLDRWGLATGILTNSVIAKFFSQRAAQPPFVLRFTLVLFFVLQCLQMVVVLTPRCHNNYLAHRLHITVLHRILRLLQHAYTITLVPVAHSYAFAVTGDRSGHVGPWRPYFITLLTMPTLALLHAINHPLPMALQVPFILMRLALYLFFLIPPS
jgi:hypothetical protein